MAISATKVTLKIGGVQIPEVTISSGLSLPYSAKGKSIEVVSVVGSGSAVSEPVYTGSVAEGSVVAAGNLTITVTDNATPTPASGTVTLAITLQEGVGDITGVNYVGWFKFKRIPIYKTYATGGIALPDVQEVLGIQGAAAYSFMFNPDTKKLMLYTSGNQISANTKVEVTLLVLEA